MAETTKTTKTTMQIAQDKLIRLRESVQKDNQINRLARYIGDYITKNGYSTKTLSGISIPLEMLCVRLTKSKLARMQYGKQDFTYSVCNDPIIKELHYLYSFKPISPFILHFGTIEQINRQDFAYNNEYLTKSEQCTQAGKYNSVTIAQDCVSACKISILNSLKEMSKDNSQIFDLLECYIITYSTEKSAKVRYKAVNALNIAGDSISQVFKEYERNKHNSIDDFNTLYDVSGSQKLSISSAISDNYADLELNNEMIEIVKKWISEIDMNDITEKIINYRLIKQYSIEQIAQITRRSEQRVKDILTEFRKKLQEFINNETPNKISDACYKKYIVLYDIFGKHTQKFETISETARALDVSRTSIQKALKNPRIATCKGYTLDTIYCDTDKKPVQHIVQKTKKAECLSPETPKIFVSDIHIDTNCTKNRSEYTKNDTKYLIYNSVNSEILAKKHIF